MNWFDKPKYKNVKNREDKRLPVGLWQKCPSCFDMTLIKQLEENMYICKCDYHFRISFEKRIEILLDPNSFEEHLSNITATDPLGFFDAKSSYKEKITTTVKKLKINEGIIMGKGTIEKKPVVFGVMEFKFLGGSMGSAVGEKIYQAMQLAIKENIPLIIVSCSGGARMHEGILSLMQMAKTCAGLLEMEERGVPFISVLTDPTTGGITASFASLGDIIIAEPNALIGFAGARVIEQTIKQKLPKGFQRSEFLQEHGFVDQVVHRKDLKQSLYEIISYF